MSLIFDIESDGFVETMTVIHCLVIKDTDTGEVARYKGESVSQGVQRLEQETLKGGFIVAHNGINFDIPAIQKLYPDFNPNQEYVRDTLVMTRLMYADLVDIDLKLIDKGKLPKAMFKKHSLEAWGYRLGEHKIDYLEWCAENGVENPWANWSQEMEDYCVQDVLTLEKLWLFLLKKEWPDYPIQLEHQVAWIIKRQINYGFLFDVAKAGQLYGKLVDHKTRLESALKTTFQPRFLRDGKIKIPKADNKRYGYSKEAQLSPVKLTEFNPGSRDHVAHWLTKMFKWKPKEFTNDGKPKVDEAVLGQLPWDQAKQLAEYYMIVKRLGQLAEGKEAWLRAVKGDGRIHGNVITNGAVTGRMTHSGPNIAQVPAGYSPYGEECRELFTVPKGKKQVGADASALELRCLAGYMAAWDNGAYIKTVTEGKKEDGTEIHTVNRKALGIESRDDAKTWFYAFIYGAGDEKLGLILTKKKGPGAKKVGKKSREDFLTNLPALGKFVKAVQAKVKNQGYLKGIDGRHLLCRSQHSSLNTLLQNCGAVIMKVALVVLDKTLQEKGYVPGTNYEFIANVHDEWQIECDEEIAESIGVCAVEAMEEAGRQLNFRCPITGEYRVGSSWKETH